MRADGNDARAQAVGRSRADRCTVTALDGTRQAANTETGLLVGTHTSLSGLLSWLRHLSSFFWMGPMSSLGMALSCFCMCLMPATRPTLTATRLTALSYTLHATAMCLMPATRLTLTATRLTALSSTLHVSPSQPNV